LDKTVVLVTHDMGEAAFFSDEIVIMREGVIVQAGIFKELLRSPRDSFVTKFIKAQSRPLDYMKE
jgi:osmoprotectant transport system ATP-binding protein